MSSRDRKDPDGNPSDGVRYDDAASHLPMYERSRQQLESFEEPVLMHAANLHERIFLAALDGTGNDAIHDPEHATNVALVARQIGQVGNPNISFGYVPGPGTQQHRPLARLFDGALGYTVDERAEEMYKKLINQAWKWKQQDPDAQIRVASLSFSRGSEEAALLARMIDERGIQDPSGAKYTYDSHHQIKHVEYTKPALVGPHKVAQAVAMFDPVGTGSAMRDDRRLPPSVISGIQFTAMDEHRGLFKSDRIIDPGITPDGRFAGVYVPGAHSDVGGGYNRNGLAIRSGNFAVDYINGLSDVPILAKTPEPDDPRLNVIHHSQEGMFLYRVAPKINRLEPGSYNDLEVSRREIGYLPDAYNAEPRDEALSRQFDRQAMPNGPLPEVQEPPREAPASELDRWIDRMYLASQNPDSAVWDRAQHEVAQAYLRSPDGQQFQQQADSLNEVWNTQWQAQQQAMQQQAVQQPTQQGFSR